MEEFPPHDDYAGVLAPSNSTTGDWRKWLVASRRASAQGGQRGAARKIAALERDMALAGARRRYQRNGTMPPAFGIVCFKSIGRYRRVS